MLTLYMMVLIHVSVPHLHSDDYCPQERVHSHSHNHDTSHHHTSFDWGEKIINILSHLFNEHPHTYLSDCVIISFNNKGYIDDNGRSNVKSNFLSPNSNNQLLYVAPNKFAPRLYCSRFSNRHLYSNLSLRAPPEFMS